MRRRGVVLLSTLLLISFAGAQTFSSIMPVVMAPVGNVQMRPGSSKDVTLDFRVGPEFHINSHTPKSPLLIPTALKLTVPPQITLAEVKYPTGQDESFAFSPDEKLNVYSGDFSIDAVLKAPANLSAGTYPVKGELRFQACDHSACYPPRTIPVQFQIIVVK
ncbi:MAG TPA: protein-disulfide reductase DsbD domain-containing protein [Terriglobales bacterium]|nr:protein-disulfide reductase DsbD domain-containing protein [Terriglobales bacterium]